jgi:hypothetical protein
VKAVDSIRPARALSYATGECASQLSKHATAIRALGKQTVDNVIEIGRRLTEAKRMLGHGSWLPWLKHEFGWTDQTARNFMLLHEFAGKPEFKKFLNLNLPVSTLYLLAAPSTPDLAKSEIIDRTAAGETPSGNEVKRVIEKHKRKAHQPQAKKAKPKAKPKTEPTIVEVLPNPRLDIGPTSISESARKDVVIEDLQHKKRMLEMKVAAMEGEGGELDMLQHAWDRASDQTRATFTVRNGLVLAPKPDDGLNIPTSLPRAPNGQ